MSTESRGVPMEHPPIVDGNGATWTWRGSGYAIKSQPDRDWKGRPWTTQADTIQRLFGTHVITAAVQRLR